MLYILIYVSKVSSLFQNDSYPILAYYDGHIRDRSNHYGESQINSGILSLVLLLKQTNKKNLVKSKCLAFWGWRGGLASQCHVALCYVPRISYESAQTHQRELKRDFDIIVKPELFKFFFLNSN